MGVSWPTSQVEKKSIMQRSRTYRNSQIHFLFYRSLVAAIMLLGFVASSSLLAQRVSLPEETEWTWEVRPPHPDPKLPNVLLLGDSISRNYFPRVSERLSGTANVYLMASSATVGDPRLQRQIAEFVTMEGVHFSTIHFNNGMHGWNYNETQYKRAFPGLVHAVRKVVGRRGVLIWATTTAVKNNSAIGPTNGRIDARNAIAISMLQSDDIAIDDQHALMMQHQDRYDDSVHFNASGAELQGDQAADAIKAALNAKKP
jgi:hypothetical protein